MGFRHGMNCGAIRANRAAGTFQRAFKSMGLAPSCLSKLSADAEAMTPICGIKKTVCYHVANAFSLLVSTIAPMPNNKQIKVISNYDR